MNEWQVDGEPEWMAGFVATPLAAIHNMIICLCGGAGIYTAEQIATRNQSIRNFWTAERRAAKAEQTRRVNRNADPEVNARRSAALRLAYQCPRLRAEISARQTEVWARRRAAKATGGDTG